MSTLPFREPNGNQPPRDPLLADTPELYESWRHYAFSTAPELLDDRRVDETPATGIRTV